MIFPLFLHRAYLPAIIVALGVIAQSTITVGRRWALAAHLFASRGVRGGRAAHRLAEHLDGARVPHHGVPRGGQHRIGHRHGTGRAPLPRAGRGPAGHRLGGRPGHVRVHLREPEGRDDSRLPESTSGTRAASGKSISTRTTETRRSSSTARPRRAGHDRELEYRMISATGKVVHLHDVVAVSPDAAGRSYSIHGVMLDVTERKRIEQRERQYADIVETIDIGLIVVQLCDPDDDLSLQLVAANPTASASLDRPLDQFAGQLLHEALPGLMGSDILVRLADVAQLGRSFEIDEIVVRRGLPDRANPRVPCLPARRRVRGDQPQRRDDRDPGLPGAAAPGPPRRAHRPPEPHPPAGPAQPVAPGVGAERAPVVAAGAHESRHHTHDGGSVRQFGGPRRPGRRRRPRRGRRGQRTLPGRLVPSPRRHAARRTTPRSRPGGPRSMSAGMASPAPCSWCPTRSSQPRRKPSPGYATSGCARCC